MTDSLKKEIQALQNQIDGLKKELIDLKEKHQMHRPRCIILVRHGQSEGNIDPLITCSKPDHSLSLTETGKEQANQVGKTLRSITGDEPVQFYLSPYTRARQTLEEIVKSYDGVQYHQIEEPRIREQDWGNLQQKDVIDLVKKQRSHFGHFFFRIPDGESGSDVYDRVSTFMETLHRDFKQSDFPRNVIIVTHGLTMRLFLMRWFHWPVEYFESLANPENCEYAVMDLSSNSKHYSLRTPLRSWKSAS
eukprot:TRINITY_DN8445_c0_g1_i1.p1 TRINITY_DN8445_c0_g1~~TRINITY_DN8445_c0_g1_i1.p1  ORF type:complete len:248 (-),score=31.92 TRINITY_DN8445_c0_g1_i1:44-787(-)